MITNFFKAWNFRLRLIDFHTYQGLDVLTVVKICGLMRSNKTLIAEYELDPASHFIRPSDDDKDDFSRAVLA